MRIAIWHNLPSGGGKRALYHQVKGLVAHGHMVEAWCPSHATLAYLPLNGLIPEHVLPCPPVGWRPTLTRDGLRTLWEQYTSNRHLLRVLNARARQ